MSKFSMLGALLVVASVMPLGCEAIVGDVDWNVGAGAGGSAGKPQAGGAGVAAASGAPTVPGDGGAAGMSTEEAGAAGVSGDGGAAGADCVPLDDANPCTEDVCLNGAPSNPASAVGTACSDGGTQCDGKGACVECLAPADCPGTDGPCQTRTCAAGVCGFDFAAAGTELPTQTAGDCKKAECDGAGKTTQATDAADVPIDSNACTTDVCTGDVPSNPKLPSGTTCGGILLCNGSGVCVGCNTASDCPGGPDTECKARTCQNNQCGTAFTAKGTALTAQTAGNCVKATCDGAGNTENVADPTDLPADDGNACTSEACSNGAPQHPAKANGTACTDGDACTSSDTCQSGACSSGTPLICTAQDTCHSAGNCNSATGVCTNPSKAEGSSCGGASVCTAAGACVACLTSSQCPGSDGECAVRTCVSNICGFSYTASGTPTAAQTSNDCQKNQCDGSGHIVSMADNTDTPADDGNQCTSETCALGVPSHPTKAPNTACNQGSGTFCTAGGTCAQCNNAAQCPGVDTDCKTRTCAGNICGVNNQPVGTLTSSQTAGDCFKNQCDGNGNIMPAVDLTDLPADDGNDCTGEACSSAGAPQHPNLPATTTCGPGGLSTCDGSGACQ